MEERDHPHYDTIVSAVAEATGLRAQLEQAHDELDAVDESLGEFYCHVLVGDDEPCGSYYEDHGVHIMRHELEKLEALADCVPEAELLKRLANDAEFVGQASWRDSMTNQDAREARALAARIEKAQGKNDDDK